MTTSAQKAKRIASAEGTIKTLAAQETKLRKQADAARVKLTLAAAKLDWLKAEPVSDPPQPKEEPVDEQVDQVVTPETEQPEGVTGASTDIGMVEAPPFAPPRRPIRDNPQA